MTTHPPKAELSDEELDETRDWMMLTDRLGRAHDDRLQLLVAQARRANALEQALRERDAELALANARNQEEIAADRAMTRALVLAELSEGAGMPEDKK